MRAHASSTDDSTISSHRRLSTSSGSKVYMVHTPAGGKSRRLTIGRHGVTSPEHARREAGSVQTVPPRANHNEVRTIRGTASFENAHQR